MLWRAGWAIIVALLTRDAGAAPERAVSGIVVQVSLTAGLSYHDAKAVWDQMKVGNALTLLREPANPYDNHAVRVDWNGHQLSYIPRTENEAIAPDGPWQPAAGAHRQSQQVAQYRRKLEFEVFLPLTAR